MKGKCSGEAVVGALVSNSATFAGKTKFAQEKYIRKKQQKHVQQVTLLEPTVMTLCETYLKQSRPKMCGLRFDYLSSLLCHADVRSDARLLVLDCACGLVVGAIAQRLAGTGRAFRVFSGSCPDKGLLELDLGPTKSVVKTLPMDVLQSQEPLAHEWLRLPEALVESATEEDKARFQARSARINDRRADFHDFQLRPIHAVVAVAGEEDAELVADAVALGLAHLRPGGRIVVFGQQIQPLAKRQGAMRSDGRFVDVRLIQLFTREYQVLPQRTHPVMTMDALLCDGFLLSATTVKAAPPGSDAAGDGDSGRGSSGEARGGRSKRRRTR